MPPYSAAGRHPPLEAADAIRLLTVMFADADVCRRNQESLRAAAAVGRETLVELLRVLIEAGLVSKERGTSRVPNTYRLLPALRRQP